MSVPAIVRSILVGALAAQIPAISLAQEIPPEKAEAIVREIQQSHISANVPPQEDFDRLLRRDLAAYFSSKEAASPRIEYELLRDGPTQSGIAYPKFYIWVRAYSPDGSARQGAARLAAIERQRFEVTHFVEQGSIAQNPSQLDALFPPPVAARIKTKVGLGDSHP